MEKGQKIGARNWFIVIFLGLAGQIAWVLENQWFNVFVYHEITTDPRPVSWMVAASAVVATITTLVMGVWSDRLGKRKPFILFGYLLWGLSTMLFPISALAQSVGFAVALVILLDCIMTFFGSTANDGAYNSWTTDISNEHNRGTLALVLSALPLISMVAVSAVAGFAVEHFGYIRFFLFTGAIVSAIGLIAGLLLKEPHSSQKQVHNSVFTDFVYTIRKETIAQNKKLYLVLLTMCIFSTATQVVMPYLMVYINKYLGFSLEEMGLYIGVAFLCGLLFALPMILLVNKGKLLFTAWIAGCIVTAGTAAFYTVKPGQLAPLLMIATVFLGSFIGMNTALTAWVKNLMPENARGRFEGIRMIFAVAIPMVVGPSIGSSVILRYGAGETLLQDGQITYIPIPHIFLFAAAIAVFAFIPLLFILRSERRLK